VAKLKAESRGRVGEEEDPGKESRSQDQGIKEELEYDEDNSEG